MSDQPQGTLFDKDGNAVPNTDNPAKVPKEQMSGNQLIQIEKINSNNLEVAIDRAETLIKYRSRIRKLVLKETHSRDWILFGDNPYLEDEGVRTVLSLIGAQVYNIRTEPEVSHNESGKKVIYYSSYGDIELFGRTFQNMGCCSTKDDFFAKRTKEIDDPDHPGKKKKISYYLDVDEINLADVKKKSVTNLLHRLLGMVFPINVSKEELEELGIKPKSGFKFKDGGKGGKVDSAEDRKKRTELHNLVVKISLAKGEEAESVLRLLTAFNEFPGYKAADDVSIKMLDKTLDKAEKLLAKVRGNK